MRLVFDARHMAMQYTGLGRYTGSLLLALLDGCTPGRLQIDVLVHADADDSAGRYLNAVSQLAADGRCTIQAIDAAPFGARHHVAVAHWVNRRGADRYFYPHFDLPLGLRVPSTFVVHDLIPLLVPGYVRRQVWLKQRYFSWMVRSGVRRASNCIAVSETTRRDVLALVGARYAAKVSVAVEGPTLGGNVAEARLAPSMAVHQPFLLYVGDRRPHKNLQRTLELFVALRDVHGYPGKLLLAGSTMNHGFDVEGFVAGRSDVVVLGNVSDDDLMGLYATTDALVFLSAYEGFGLPIVEAARFHRRMVVSDGGALAEIAPPHACVLPRDLPVSEAASRVAAYLARSAVVDCSDFNARFSWNRAARQIFPEAFA